MQVSALNLNMLRHCFIISRLARTIHRNDPWQVHFRGIPYIAFGLSELDAPWEVIQKVVISIKNLTMTNKV